MHLHIRYTRKALFPPECLLLYQIEQGKSIPKRLPMRPPRLLAAYRNENGHKRCGDFWQRAKQHAGRLAEEVLPPRHSSAGSACPFFAEAKAAAAPQRSSRMRSLPLRPHPGFPSPPPHSGGGDRDGSAVFSSLKKIFSFFSRTIDFCAAQGFILFSAEKCGASPNETRASAALYAGCKYKAFARPFCGARKGRKHKKSHLPLGVLPLAERTNAGNSRSE